ncbi:MAG: alkaline phosphatase family protein [Alphaproteobacteria bacterium]|nr:alkaline phosphatase family protein [Alphaproteobacteria bacterium]
MATTKRPKRVLLFLADQWRGDTLRSTGHKLVRTPNIDRLAAEGVTFRRHYTNATPCGPARTSLLTGLYMMNHRVVRNGTPLDVRHTNLALEVRKSGTKPAIFGYTSNTPDPRGLSPDDPTLREQHGNIPGFEEIAPGLPTAPPYMAHVKSLGYHVPGERADFWLPPENYPGAQERGPTYAPARFKTEHSDNAFLVDEAIKYLRVREDRPWFVHVATMRPHPPFIAPDPYHDLFHPDEVPALVRAPSAAEEGAQHPLLDFLLKTTPQREYFRTGVGLATDLDEKALRQLRATYYGMMAELDHHVGRLLDYLRESGQYEDTLIVFSSDHGEQLGDHWLLGKQGYFEASYHIPLIVRAPGRDADGARGKLVDDFTEAVDLMPTILEWLDRDVPHQCDGQSLLSYCRGQAPAQPRRDVHYEFDFRDVLTGDPQRMLGLRMEQCSLAALRDDRYKYVHFPSLPPLFFDLREDPHEMRNLAGEARYASLVRDYAQRMLTWRMEHMERTLTVMQAGPDGLKTIHEPRR